MFDFAPDAYLVTDGRGIIQEVNGATESLLEVHRDFCIGKPLVLFVAESDRTFIYTQLDLIARSSQPPKQGSKNQHQRDLLSSPPNRATLFLQDREVSVQPRKQAAFPASLSLSAEFGSQGAIARVYWLFRDLRDRQQLEAELRRREQQFASLVENSPDIIFRLDLELRHTYISPRVTETSGLSTQDFLGKTGRELGLPAAACDVFEAACRDAIATGEVTRVEYAIADRHHVSRLIPERSASGAIESLMGITEDISDRKQAEAALRSSEELRRLALDLTNTASWDWNLATGEVVWSDDMFRILGLTPDAVSPNYKTWHDRVSPEDLERLEASISLHLQDRTLYSEEYRVLYPDGSIHWLLSKGRGVYDAADRAVRMVGITMDISDRKCQEATVAADLRDTQLLRNLSLRSIAETDIQVLYDEIVAVAIALMHSDAGSLQILDRSRNELQLQADRGFHPDAAAFWQRVGMETGSVCGVALERGEQTIVPDIETCDFLAGTANLDYYRLCGLRAIQSSPLIARSGQLIGMFSTHWQECYQPSDRELRFLDLLARQAADLIEQRQAEAALRESEALHRTLFDSIDEGICLFERLPLRPDGLRDYRYLAMNPTMQAMFGIPDLSGQSIRDNFPEEVEDWYDDYDRVLETGEAIRFERESEPQGMVLEMFVTRVGEGSGQRLLAVMQNVTDRKRAEEKIREQAALLDIVSDAIFTRDLEHRILYWNRGAERLYGWTAAETIAQKAYELLQLTPARLAEIVRSLFDRGEWRGELQKVAKTRREILVEASWTLVRDEAGQAQSILCVETDITEKKQQEAQFYHAQRLESLGTLASGIAHDLNNVLTPILAISQLLRGKQTNLDERSQQMLQILEESSKRGANLVQQILTFARGSEGERVSLSVVSVLQEVVQVAQQTFPKSIEIRQNIRDRETGLVSADPTQLHQIFVNLCVNARDAMPDGGTIALSAENYYIDEIFVQMHPDARLGNYVLVTVADTGTGIPPKVRDRIFEPFFTTKEIGKGTGLGLSTVLGIVKSYGGFVEVQSQLGAGSQFKVYLPLLEAVATVVEEQTNLSRGQGESILVVDDEVNIIQVTQALLETYNYRVLTANNGIEAIARYVEHMQEIQVVLMDMMMPEMDGPNAIQALRKINPQVKIVATSGLSSDYRRKARSLGIDTFLTKPFTAIELLQSIQIVNGE